MSRTHTAYTEVIYTDNDDGSCDWVGHIHPYTSGEKSVVTAKHSAKSRPDANKAARKWSSETLDNDYKAPEPTVLKVVGD